MYTPSRRAILICALLAVLTPFAAGAVSWHYFDEAQRGGPLYWLLYWPMLAIDLLPARIAGPLLENALPRVLLYFAGYLFVDQLWRGRQARRRFLRDPP